MLDYVSALRRECARFGDVLHRHDLDAPVPSCPGWTLADLGWHLTEVQQFWSETAGRLLLDPSEAQTITRPDQDAELPELFDVHSAALLAAVGDHRADDKCWSWDEAGGTIAWVRRRQAHEALIHRIDAELAAGVAHDPIDPNLAADGVDEILRVMMSGVPPWGAFTPDGRTVALVATDTGSRWAGRLGRFTGTSPNTGTIYDDEALDLADDALGAVTTTIAATAADLDRWLWGRGDAATLAVDGDATAVNHIRALAGRSTQ
jgi:uncharacterized protein (TIGR03083 family)